MTKSKSRKAFHFGPYLGEFGFEIVGWRSIIKNKIRALKSKGYDIFVSSTENREILYDDCDYFIPIDYELLKDSGIEKFSRHNFWLDTSDGDYFDEEPENNRIIEKINFFNKYSNVEYLVPKHVGYSYGRVSIPKRWRFWKKQENLGPCYPGHLFFNNVNHPLRKHERLGVDLGSYEFAMEEVEIGNSINIIPRKRESYSQQNLRNWSEENYKELIEKISDLGYQIFLFGNNESFLRNYNKNVINKISKKMSLKEQCAITSLCDATVAPDTGANHISLMMGVPVITWLKKKSIFDSFSWSQKKRYLPGGALNPLGTEISIVEDKEGANCVSEIIVELTEKAKTWKNNKKDPKIVNLPEVI